jgi:hypothetical protein
MPKYEVKRLNSTQSPLDARERSRNVGGPVWGGGSIGRCGRNAGYGSSREQSNLGRGWC